MNANLWLEALADPGGICVTRGVRDYIGDKIEYTFDEMGEQKVKNIPRPIRVFKVRFDPDGTTEIDIRPAAEPPPSKASLDPVDVDIELTFWNSVKDSEDLQMFGAYLEKYPDGEFHSLGEIRIEQLRNDQTGVGRISS